MKRLFLGLILAVTSIAAFGQSAIVRGETTAGTYSNIGAFQGSADGQSQNQFGLVTLGYNYVYNGASWDRLRGVLPGDGDATSGGSLLATVKQTIFNGATWDRQRSPSKFVNISLVTITAETTIWTPAAGKKFRLMGFCLTQTTVAGNITLKDNTAGTTILIIPANTAGAYMCSNPIGNGILSAAANNVLTATGASTEVISGFVYGTEE